MTDQKKGRTDCHQATFITAFGNRYFNRLGPLIKALILTLAVWGWLPMAFADRFVDQGGTQDE